MKFFRRLLAVLPLLAVMPGAQADWFVSSEVKALTVKAQAGDVDAQLRVGAAYDSGHGAPHDEAEALRWYTMAAETGDAEAQNSLGSVLQARKQYVEARAWYERAAAQGHALATNNLAFLYDLGLGIPQDRHKGFELYTHAADLGWAEAMWNLANMYGAGQLGAEDLYMACVWTFRAERYAAPRQEPLLAYLHRAEPQIERRLNTEQRERCYQQAAEWKPAGKIGAPGQAASAIVVHHDLDAARQAPPVQPASAADPNAEKR